MTSEEAISLLMNISAYDIDNKRGMQKQEALAMAIQALEQPCETTYGSTYGGVSWGGTYTFKEQQPSEDCISREAVIKHICESKECYKDECKGRLYKRCFDLQWIYDLPSVTLQPNTGHWIKMGDGFTPYECSECEAVEFKKSKYCPNCGAKMEVE